MMRTSGYEVYHLLPKYGEPGHPESITRLHQHLRRHLHLSTCTTNLLPTRAPGG